MGNLIILFMNLLGGAHKSSAPARKRGHLWLLAAILIAVLAPDLIAALEMNALLELLGAALFWVAFISGAQMLAMSAGSALRSLLFLRGDDWLLDVPAISARSAAMFWMGINSLMLLLPIIVLGAHLTTH